MSKKMIDQLCRHCDRRQLFRWTARSALTGLGLGGTWGSLARALTNHQRRLQLDGEPHRLLLLYLDGGWNAHLAVDAIYGDRLKTGNFETVYGTQGVKTPAGKDKLVTGLGFQNAFPAFETMPTAFVNGMNVEIAAHDAASAYMFTGKATIGRQIIEPSFPALIATKQGGIGSHVVFGGSIPLGDTIETAPPVTTSGDALGELLTPAGGALKAESQAAIEAALARIDEGFYQSVGDKAKTSLDPFRAAQSDLVEVFANFNEKLRLGQAIKDRYGVKDNWQGANFAAAFLALSTDFTPIVTIRYGNFDTHSNELGTQLPRQQELAALFSTFVADLAATPDPAAPGKSLAETTTIVITSEFIRTAKFNDTAGTDHQDSSSAIVMGKGIKDNVVIGSTNELGRALGWEGGKAVEKNEATMIDGGTLVATMLDLFGMPEEAAKIATRRLDGLLG